MTISSVLVRGVATAAVALFATGPRGFAQPDPFVDGVVRAADVDVKPDVLEKRVPSAGEPHAQVPEGELRVEFVIERDGTVRYVRGVGNTDPYRSTLESAIGLMRRWTFTPGRQGGAIVRTLATVNVSISSRPGGRRGAGPPSQRLVETWDVVGVDDAFAAGAAKATDPGVTWPRVKKERKPQYPRELLKDKVDGSVELELVVLPTGQLRGIRVVSSNDERFEAAALQAGREWEFEGGSRNGQPVPVLVMLMLEFRAR